MGTGDNPIHGVAASPKPKHSWIWWTRQVFGALFVLLVLLVLISMAFPRLGNRCGGSNFIASVMGNTLWTACENYKAEYGRYPNTSENYRLYLILNGGKFQNENPRGMQFFAFDKKDISPNGEILDPWKTPYRIVFDDKGVLVTSAGKDKLFGTKDDITNRK